MTQTDKGLFVQFPIYLIYECPTLTRDDKWVLLSMMGKCWTDGPQRLSYRDIAAISGTPISLLSSFDDKQGKHHEGIIERLEHQEWIHVAHGKEVNPSTGKLKGNAQTYIYINYTRIWQENVTYCQSRNIKQNAFSVKDEEFKPVSYTNRCVSHENTFDIDTNKPVSNRNTPVSHESKPVSASRSKASPYITNITEIDSDKKEESADAPFVTSHPSSSFSETHSQLPIASRHYETSNNTDVTQVSQESEAHHANLPLSAHPGFAGSRSELPAVSAHDITGNAITADWHPVPDGTPGRDVSETGMAGDILESHGYEKGGSDESSTDSIWDRDAGGSSRDTTLHPAPDQHCVGDPQEQTTQTAAQEVTQQTPLSQGLPPALDGDARERSAPPVATALLLSHTLQGTSLLGEMSLDALLSQPRGERTEIKALLSQVRGQMTRMTQGESIRAGDTSSEATSQSTETAPMKPASQNKTVQGKENKKTRGTSETQPETLLESPLVEPDMHGIWNHEKVIQYTEWCLGERYRDTERTRQLNAAKAIHKDDFKLTLEDYKDAYDERNDEWWHEVKGQLHVSHMRGKEKDSGIDRLHAMLGKIAARKAKGSGKTSSSSSAPLGGMYKDKTAELAAERKKYLPPSSEAVTPRIVASATTFSYTR